MTKFFISVLIPLLILIVNLNAQTVSTDWKDVEKVDFTVGSEQYPEASAIVLFDIGKAYFTVVDNELKLVYERQTRIRINTTDGYKFANIEIPFYEHQEYEDVTSLHAFTYNLKKGKVDKEKLKQKDVYDENIDDRGHQLKFSFPMVKEGSVIEYKYSIVSSDFIDFRTWEFQKSIPVLYSKFTTRIPEYFRYASFFQGMESLDYRYEESYKDAFSFQKEKSGFDRANRTAGARGAINTSNYQDNTVTIEYMGTETEYVMEDIAPLKDLPFVASLNDYRAKMRFQLAEKRIPGVDYQTYYTTWEDLSNELLKNTMIGLQLNRNNKVKKQTEELIEGIEDPVKKIEAIYNYVANSMKWDGFYRYAVYDNLNTAFSEKKGNSAEINLILTLMLREAGLESYPVLVSTRSHGQIIMAYPVINQFNHLISYVKLDGEYYLLDAIDNDLAWDMIPEDDLNGKGLVLIKDHPIWVDLKSNKRNINRVSAIVSFDEKLKMKCTNESISKGYPAVNRFKDYRIDRDKYISENYLSNGSDLVLDTFNIGNDLNNLKEYAEYTGNTFATVSGDMVYIQPMLMYGLSENPFKSESRKVPVDFTYPYEKTFVLNIDLPRDYKVVENPESVKLLLPHSGGEFVYYFVLNENKAQIISTLKLKRNIYSSDEYPFLKEFFTAVVDKHAEQIVLQKESVD